jgi:hypothetical protein
MASTRAAWWRMNGSIISCSFFTIDRLMILGTGVSVLAEKKEGLLF